MKNQIRIEGDLTYIISHNKKHGTHEAVIDTKNLEKVKDLNYSWHLKYAENTRTFYSRATKYLGITEGKPKYQNVYLHHVIKPITTKGNVIHHKNHDTLNNTEENLQEVSNQRNLIKREGTNINNKLGIRNVSFNKQRGFYEVQFYVDGNRILYGSYSNPQDAELAAIKGRQEHYSDIG